jgi:pimeloyl-ACP methyl ester carboxylesterase
MKHLLLFLFLPCWSTAQVTINAIGTEIPASDGFPLLAFELFKGKKHKPPKHPSGLFFYIQGSEPATVTDKIGLLASAVIMHGRVILVEKRGCTPEKIDSATFYRYDDKATRISDHLEVINRYLKNLPPSLPVVVVGGSEGGDIAAALAQKCPRITHLILIGSGGGISQKTEFEQMVAQQPGYLGCQNVRELDSTFALIRHSPDSLAMWAGHPYKRWNSYLYDSTITFLHQVGIPILMFHGDADANVPVASARSLHAAFQKTGKTNLTYIEYRDVDHTLMNVRDGKSRYPVMEVDIVDWMTREGLIPEKYARRLTKRVKKAHPDVF